MIIELFRWLQLQLSGVFRIKHQYSYSFLVSLAQCSYRNNSLGNPQDFSTLNLQLQLYDLMVFELNVMISKRMVFRATPPLAR